MLAWSHLIEIWLNTEERILVICDDPWVYRHLLVLGVEVCSPPAGFRLLELVFFCRGYLARLKYAFSAAFAVIRLRKLKIAVKGGAPVLLVYGHPASDAEGHDAYFGDLMYREPEVRRMIHVDCSPGRALELAGDNRTASLHAWGSILFAFSLPFAVWRPNLKLIGEKIPMANPSSLRSRRQYRSISSYSMADLLSKALARITATAFYNMALGEPRLGEGVGPSRTRRRYSIVWLSTYCCWPKALGAPSAVKCGLAEKFTPPHSVFGRGMA